MRASCLVWSGGHLSDGLMRGPADPALGRCLIARFDVSQPVVMPAHAVDQPLARVELLNLPPRHLLRAQVRAHGQVAYQLDSISDLRGNLIPAGELAMDMARMSGQHRLQLDLRHLGLAGDGITLRLWLPSDASAWVNDVRARARRH